MSEIAERLRGPIMEAVQRLIAGSFRRDGERLEESKRPRFSIPCRPDRDDDTVAVEGIKSAADHIERLEAALRECRARMFGSSPAMKALIEEVDFLLSTAEKKE